MENDESEKQYEILIIDNNSTDGTYEAISRSDWPDNIRSFVEEKQGLSNARNRGVKESRGSWLFFLDDDCFVPKDFIVSVTKIILEFNFACFGGVYEPYFVSEVPKWVKPDLFESHLSKFGEIRCLDTEYLTGGCLCIQKRWILDAGFFSTHLGMKGDLISYAEETLLQKRLRDQGVDLWVVPELKVKHLVGSHKLNLIWHIRSKFAKGRDHTGILHRKLNGYEFALICCKIIFLGSPISFLKSLLLKNYYWQNMIIDVFGSIGHAWGRYRGAIH